MSPQKWIKETNAIGMISKSGRYGGGTFAISKKETLLYTCENVESTLIAFYLEK